ncbi:DgyrCDS14645 [Dimorphilus gyrociliatus]|uniref:DgyrCDS14645 n=1 Tax=Dimorphilus gyrociliatus TaxID=2664684 RepID=A0A7I8WEL5_9ANNE|nr:DgyrCDS14645 [Dimorphilus gyrociliatus]
MSKRNLKGCQIDKNSEFSQIDIQYLNELKERINLQILQLEINECVCQLKCFNWPNIVEEILNFFNKFIREVKRIIEEIHNVIFIFIEQCQRFKNEETNFTEISVKRINSLDNLMSEFIESIQEFDIILQELVEESEILQYSDTLNCKTLFMEKHTLMTLDNDLRVATNILYNDLHQLINQFLFVVSPTPEIVKYEKRNVVKSEFTIRLMCSEALKLTTSIGIKEINIIQQIPQMNTSTYELQNKSPKKVIYPSGMVNFEFDLLLQNTSQNKDRLKIDKDNAVASFRYYLNVDLEKFKWHNREFNLCISTRAFGIISQTSQVVQATGNMKWFRCFGEATRKPWSEFKNLLLDYYHRNTGRHLTSEQINYLRDRFMLENDDSIISLNDFLQKRYSDRSTKTNCIKLQKSNFTPWYWFVACINLLNRKEAKQYWQQGLIYGFISKEYADRILTDCHHGTFLVRFAESRIQPTQKAAPNANFTLAVKYENTIYHLQDYLTFNDLEDKKLDLFQTLNEMTIHSTGNKLVANGQVVLSPIENQPLKLKIFTEILSNNNPELSEDCDYNAEGRNYHIILKSSNRTRNKFIAELNGKKEEFEPLTPVVNNTPFTIVQDVLSTLSPVQSPPMRIFIENVCISSRITQMYVPTFQNNLAKPTANNTSIFSRNNMNISDKD